MQAERVCHVRYLVAVEVGFLGDLHRAGGCGGRPCVTCFGQGSFQDLKKIVVRLR